MFRCSGDNTDIAVPGAGVSDCPGLSPRLFALSALEGEDLPRKRSLPAGTKQALRRLGEHDGRIERDGSDTTGSPKIQSVVGVHVPSGALRLASGAKSVNALA